MSTNITCTDYAFYRGGRTPLGPYVGYEPGSGVASVARFKFRTGAAGASHIQFKSNNATAHYVTPGDYDAYSTIVDLRWIITTSPTGYEGYLGNAGYACTYSNGYWVGGDEDMGLLPNTDYYVWIFPNFKWTICMWDIGYTLNISLDGTYGVPTTPTVSDGFFGRELSIGLERQLSSMLHTVTLSCAGETVELINMEPGYPSVKWTPELETFAPLVTESNFAQLTVSVRTYLNGIDLGTKEKTVKLSFPEDVLNPVLLPGWAAAEIYNQGTAAEGIDRYVSGYSRAKVNFDGSLVDLSGLYGASLSHFTMRVKNQTLEAEPYLSPVLTDETELICTAVDSRGHESCQTITISPCPYAPPGISETELFRCDAQGNPGEDFWYYSARAKLSFSSLEGANSCSLYTSFRRPLGSFGPRAEMESQVPRVFGTIDPDLSWEIRIEAMDALGNSCYVSGKLPTRKWAMKFNAQGTAVAFGKAPETDRALELHQDWEIVRSGRKLDWYSETLGQCESIGQGADLDHITAIGNYGCADSATVSTVTERPTEDTAPFTLIVRNAAGDGHTGAEADTGTACFIQEYRSAEGPIWRRSLSLQDSAAVFGDWKRLLDSENIVNLNATVPVSAWAAESVPGMYCQFVSVPGILPTDILIVDLQQSGALANQGTMDAEWSKIIKAVPSGVDRLFIRAGNLPTVDLPMNILRIRRN